MRILVRSGGGRDGRNHHRAAVAAERVLEQPRELRVAVRHVAAALAARERVDAVAEREQGAIDVGTLFELRAAVERNGGALGAGEVDERELPERELIFHACRTARATQPDLQHCVRARRLRVRRRLRDAAGLIAALNQLEHLGGMLRLVLREAAHANAACGLVPQLKPARRRCHAGHREQVPNRLIVHLQVGDAQRKAMLLLGTVHRVEEGLDGEDHDTRPGRRAAEHRVRLAAPGCAVCEDGRGEALRHKVDERARRALEDERLAAVLVEDMVICVAQIPAAAHPYAFSAQLVWQDALAVASTIGRLLRVEGEDAAVDLLDHMAERTHALRQGGWPDAHCHLDVLLRCSDGHGNEFQGLNFAQKGAKSRCGGRGRTEIHVHVNLP